jgi:hypothetical protein
MDNGYSFEEAISLASSSYDLTYPEDCNYQQAFDSSCSDAGLACSDDAYVVPTAPNFATAGIASIEAYQESVASYAECWGDNGPYRRTASCVSDTDFVSWKGTLNSALPAIEEAMQDDDALDALELAQASVEEAITAVQRSMDNVQPSPSPSPAPPGPSPAGRGQTSPEAIDGATVGTIVVACLVGVALIGGAIAVHLQV